MPPAFRSSAIMPSEPGALLRVFFMYAIAFSTFQVISLALILPSFSASFFVFGYIFSV